MLPILNEYKIFKKLFPKEIQVATLIFIIHMMRKTILNKGRAMGDTSVDSSTFLLLGCLALNIYIIKKNSGSIKKAIKETQLFFVFTVWCFLSFMWSIVPGFSTILLKDVEIIISSLAVSVILYRIKDRFRCMIWLLYLTTCSTLLGLTRSVMTGEMHTNTYTIVGAVGVFLALGMYKIYDIKWVKWMGIINLSGLILGTSSASNISFLIAFIVYLSTGKRGINVGKTLTLIIFLYFGYEYLYDLLYEYIFWGHSEASIESGTGRYEVWGEFIEGWKLSPWLGHGYIIGERNLEAMGGHPFIFSCHNGYLSVLVNTGIIGCCLFTFLLFKIFNTAVLGSYNHQYGKEMTILFCCFVVLLINNASYPALGSDWNFVFPPLWAMITLILTLRYKS